MQRIIAATTQMAVDVEILSIMLNQSKQIYFSTSSSGSLHNYCLAGFGNHYGSVIYCLSYQDSVCNAGDQGLIPGLGRSPGEGLGNPLQYSCLESPMDRGIWWATGPKGHKELDMTEATFFFNGPVTAVCFICFPSVNVNFYCSYSYSSYSLILDVEGGRQLGK